MVCDDGRFACMGLEASSKPTPFSRGRANEGTACRAPAVEIIISWRSAAAAASGRSWQQAGLLVVRRISA